MTQSRFQTVAVIGAGTMGHALALVHAIGGCDVRLHDNNPEILDRATGLISRAVATLAEAGVVADADTDAIRARIKNVPGLADAVPGAGLIVEAVVEVPEIKKTVFSAIDRAADAGAIIASNTSELDIFPLVPQGRQRHAVIAHWYTPPYVIDLVEIAPGPETDQGIVEDLGAFYRSIGKAPVCFDRLIPGYIANRIQAAVSLEVFNMLDEGWATPKMIDDSIRYGLALRWALLGHIQKADYAGVPMALNSQRNKSYTPPEVTGRSKTLEALVEAGRHGVQAGVGFYDYGDQSATLLFRERDLKLLHLKKSFNEIYEDVGDDAS